MAAWQRGQCRHRGDAEREKSGTDRSHRGSVDRAEAKAMTALGGFEEHLKVSVRPLPERSLRSHRPARVEHFAQADDQSLPLFVGEPAIEIHSPRNADRKT